MMAKTGPYGSRYVYNPPLDAELLRKEYESGMTQPEIAAKYNVGRSRIALAMKKNGIQPRKHGKRLKHGADNPNYRGDDVCYGTLHERVRNARGKPKYCHFCGEDDPSRRYDWANLTGDYHDIYDYFRACRHCHQIYDLKRRKTGDEFMSSFISKMRTITLGVAHDLLDSAIDLNSPSALRQYTRDLEDALAKMRDEAAVQAAAITTLNREHADLRAKIETGKLAIKAFQAANHTDLARARATEVVALQAEYDRTATDLENQRQVSMNLDAAVEKLNLKHAAIVARVHELERIDRTTKAKEQSASALSAASSLISSGVGISVDDIESKMRARGDVADEKFNRAMADTHVDEDPATAGQVDDLLASLAPEKKTA
jgi:phage shock protein A